MAELWIRLLAVVAVGVVAVGVAHQIRSRSTIKPRAWKTTTMSPGVYLFTSSSCADCATAMAALTGYLGAGGFAEIAWETAPDTFSELGVEAVPSTLIVDDARRATLYPGHPERTLEALSP